MVQASTGLGERDQTFSAQVSLSASERRHEAALMVVSPALPSALSARMSTSSGMAPEAAIA